MKLKKFISLMLACSMILGLAGCGKKDLQEIDEETETEISIRDISGYVADDEAESLSTPILNLDDFKKTVVFNRPSVENREEYIVLPEGYKDVQVLEARKVNITYDDINKRLKQDCWKNQMAFTSAADMTDEQAATITSQKYQTMRDYLAAVIEQLSLSSIYQYDSAVFLNIVSSIAENIEYNGCPEEIYEYATLDSQVLAYGLTHSYGYNDVCDAIDSKNELYDTLIAEIEDMVETVEIYMYMAEDNGITEPSDRAYDILMAQNGLFDYTELYDYYTRDELINELYCITLAETMANNATVITYEEYESELYQQFSETEEESITVDDFLAESAEETASETDVEDETAVAKGEQDIEEPTEYIENDIDLLFGEIEIVG